MTVECSWDYDRSFNFLRFCFMFRRIFGHQGLVVVKPRNSDSNSGVYFVTV